MSGFSIFDSGAVLGQESHSPHTRWLTLRRGFTGSVLLAGLWLMMHSATVLSNESEIQDKIPFYIGTYTGGASQGIYRSTLSLTDGKLSKPTLVAEITNPSFLTLHPSEPYLYAVSEVAEGDRQIVAFRIEEDGELTELNSIASGGNGPCYISTDALGEFAFVANYGSGSISVIRLATDGSLGQVTSQIRHEGSSVNPQRQSSPHAHCIQLDPSGRFVCAVDLGLDQVIAYAFDRSTGKLTDNGHPFRAEPGDGPRHIAFHPDGKRAFVIHELTCMLSSCNWDAKTGTLVEVDRVSTLPTPLQKGDSTAEVLVHPNGKFVYGSNRGHDTIASFQLDDTGKLTATGHTPTGGKTPRNFRIDPTGDFLLAENQNSDSIVVFRINAADGTLTQTPHDANVGSPCCIKFFSDKSKKE